MKQSNSYKMAGLNSQSAVIEWLKILYIYIYEKKYIAILYTLYNMSIWPKVFSDIKHWY